MELRDFDFPQVDTADVAFPTFNTIPELLAEAKARGFDDWNHPYSKLFGQLFFNGGKVKFKKGVPEDFKNKAWAYYRSFAGSWAPKHEHKMAICAMLLSELVEPELEKE